MLQALPGTGFEVRVLFTVGDAIGAYRPPGIVDGLVPFEGPAGRVTVLATHELAADAGYPWRLDNGTELVGARITRFELDAAGGGIVAAGPAIRAARDRRGLPVTRAAQVSERPAAGAAGFETFCSAAGYAAGTLGFVDDVFFANEEVSAREAHPHGGSIWALDVANGELWALPALGRGSWENVAAVAAPEGHVALLLGDDLEFGGAPLYLWIGRREPDGAFPARNGLVAGALHVFVADSGARTPADFRGTGRRLDGRFVPLAARDPERAGEPGYDPDGWLDDVTLRARAFALGAFEFSRPEDLHGNPASPREVAFASTGHGERYPEDDWGTLYRVRVGFGDADADAELPGARARLEILHDGDDFGDFGVRSPDNLVWAGDGRIYVQEDAAVKRARFAAASGREASIWRIDPNRPDDYARIAVVDRGVLLPAGATDRKAGVPGAWETSGIIDVSHWFAGPGEIALLATVQAHGIDGSAVGGRTDLVQSGQLVLLRGPAGAAR